MNNSILNSEYETQRSFDLVAQKSKSIEPNIYPQSALPLPICCKTHRNICGLQFDCSKLDFPINTSALAQNFCDCIYKAQIQYIQFQFNVFRKTSPKTLFWALHILCDLYQVFIQRCMLIQQLDNDNFILWNMNFSWKFDEHSFEMISSICFPNYRNAHWFRNGTELCKVGKIYF